MIYLAIIIVSLVFMNMILAVLHAHDNRYIRATYSMSWAIALLLILFN